MTMKSHHSGPGLLLLPCPVCDGTGVASWHDYPGTYGAEPCREPHTRSDEVPPFDYSPLEVRTL